jgi:hypothetical protein
MTLASTWKAAGSAIKSTSALAIGFLIGRHLPKPGHCI